jgi:hypothetical protein
MHKLLPDGHQLLPGRHALIIGNNAQSLINFPKLRIAATATAVSSGAADGQRRRWAAPPSSHRGNPRAEQSR